MTGHPGYPNGRCDACGHGNGPRGVCANVECDRCPLPDLHPDDVLHVILDAIYAADAVLDAIDPIWRPWEDYTSASPHDDAKASERGYRAVLTAAHQAITDRLSSGQPL